MEINQVLNWPDGAGWLILSSKQDDNTDVGEIRTMALTRMLIDGGVAYIGTDDDDHEVLIEEMGEMGAPTGYLVNVMTESDDAIRDTLADSGMILITGAYDSETLRSALLGAALEGITQAYARGAIILAEGESAMLFGSVIASGAEGFNWLEKAFIVPDTISVGESELACEALSAGAADFVIGIGPDSALVLGPERQIETWGEGKVAIALGGAAIDE